MVKEVPGGHDKSDFIRDIIIYNNKKGTCFYQYKN